MCNNSLVLVSRVYRSMNSFVQHRMFTTDDFYRVNTTRRSVFDMRRMNNGRILSWHDCRLNNRLFVYEIHWANKYMLSLIECTCHMCSTWIEISNIIDRSSIILCLRLTPNESNWHRFTRKRDITFAQQSTRPIAWTRTCRHRSMIVHKCISVLNRSRPYGENKYAASFVFSTYIRHIQHGRCLSNSLSSIFHPFICERSHRCFLLLLLMLFVWLSIPSSLNPVLVFRFR
jgi:hypothetical protein